MTNLMEESATREFLRVLHYPNRANQKIFSEIELKSESVKWLKRLLLVRAGFSTLEDLNKQVQRFHLDRLDSAREKCKTIVQEALFKSRRFMIILKSVPKDSSGLL